MKRDIPRWCKEAKVAMVWKNLDYEDVAKATGYTRQHVSAVVNGRAVSEPAIKRISDFLGISDDYKRPA